MTKARTAWYVAELDPKHRNHLKNTKDLAEKLDQKEKTKAKHYINGYLTALKNAGLISDVQRRVLFTYYTINL